MSCHPWDGILRHWGKVFKPKEDDNDQIVIELQENYELSSALYNRQCDDHTPIEITSTGITLYREWLDFAKKATNVRFSKGAIGFHFSLYILEWISLIMSILLGFFDESLAFYSLTSVIFWIVFALICSEFKLADAENNGTLKEQLCKDLFVVTNAFLPVKAIRYIQSLKYHSRKLEHLYYKPGRWDPVYKSRLQAILNVSKEEIIGAKYDSYDSYLHGLPMAYLQYYILINTTSGFRLIGLVDVCRLFYVISQLVSAVNSSIGCDFTKKAYLISCDYLESILSGHCFTRFQKEVHDYRIFACILNALCHAFSVLSRFYMICFFSAIHWIYGMLCVTSLLLCNWILVRKWPHMRSTIENLPHGLSTPYSYAADRLINIFTAKDTRFHELTKLPFQIGDKIQFRFPLIFTQFFTFSFSFLFVWLSIKSVDLIGWTAQPTAHIVASRGNSSTLLCKSLIVFLSKIHQMFSPQYGETDNLFSVLHLHWLLMCCHVATALFYNLYVIRAGLEFDKYPASISNDISRNLFAKICEHSGIECVVDHFAIKRMMFLLALNLPDFDEIYRGHRLCLKKHEWWNQRFGYMLKTKCSNWNIYDINKFLARNALLHDICSTFEIFCDNLEHDTKTLFCYFAERFESVSTYEMTSDRFERMFQLMDLSSTNFTPRKLKDSNIAAL